MEYSDLKDARGLVSSELKQYVAAKLFTNLKHLKGVSTFLPISEKNRVAIASEDS